MKKPTQKQKIQQYEQLLHSIQMYAVVSMNSEKALQLIGNICTWSYAHRQGNGTLRPYEQQRLIDNAFWKLTEIKDKI